MDAPERMEGEKVVAACMDSFGDVDDFRGRDKEVREIFSLLGGECP